MSYSDYIQHMQEISKTWSNRPRGQKEFRCLANMFLLLIIKDVDKSESNSDQIRRSWFLIFVSFQRRLSCIVAIIGIKIRRFAPNV